MLKTTDTKIVCMNLKKTCNSLDGNKCKMVNGVCVFQHTPQPLQECNCKRFIQRIDGRFYCRDCGKVEYAVF